jgi:very-short-patch-repair endonuclease
MTTFDLKRISDIIQYIDIEKTNDKFGPIRNSLSKVVGKCSCGAFIDTSIKSIRRTLRRKGSYACIGCRTNESWKSKEYRKQHAKALKQVVDRPAYREKKSIAATQQWQDPEYREKHKRARLQPEYVEKWRAIRSSSSYRKKLSDGAKKFWRDSDLIRRFLEGRNNPDWIKKHSDSIKKTWGDHNYKEKRIEIAKNLWRDEEYRKKHSEIWSDADRLRKQSEIIKKVWENSEYAEVQAKRRAEFLRSNKRSSIEVVTANLLALIGVKFEEQKCIGPYTFDFFLPDDRLLIECQGEYWHSLPRAKKNDASKFSYLEKAMPDSRILYLQEREFLNPGRVKQRLIDGIYGLVGEGNVEDFTFNDVTISVLDNTKTKTSRFTLYEEFLNSFHYAQHGRKAKICFGAFINDILIAVCKFSGVIRREVATTLNRKTCEVLELDRFCIHPLYHKKNFASWFMTRAIKLTFEAFPAIIALVSFVDTTYGHDGTIYKASNWTFVGKVKPDYYYIDSDGWMMHKKTLFDHAKKLRYTEKQYADKFGYIKVFGKTKMKFMIERAQ